MAQASCAASLPAVVRFEVDTRPSSPAQPSAFSFSLGLPKTESTRPQWGPAGSSFLHRPALGVGLLHVVLLF